MQDKAATPPTDCAPLPQGYREHKQALLQGIKTQKANFHGVQQHLKHLSELTDRTLTMLWREAGFDRSLAFLAVGGYGREELFPYSDVDALVLLPQGRELTKDASLRSRIERFINACWDVGLEIGSSVRSLDECLALARTDVTVQTALLESRLITGSSHLPRAFRHTFFAQLDAFDFFVAKRLEMRQRHAKYEDTPYALEPNCKESPGGLRDLQIILWTARAAGIGSKWHDLSRAGLVTDHELRQLRRNYHVLSSIRVRLHLAAGRRKDRLVFDLQNTVAESFGFQHKLAPNGKLVLRASEMLMRRYYWAAKAVTQLNEMLLQSMEEHLRRARGDRAPKAKRLNARFLDKDGLLEVARDDLYQRHPHAILETFLLFARKPSIVGLSVRTLRALYNARSLMDHAFRNDPVNRQTFLTILKQPQGVTRAFRLMNQTSVLGRYLWVFRRIVGQMQHDLFHVYTVDQHVLMVLRNVRRFFIAEHAHEYPFCSQLAAGWDKPWILYVAALFHDIAKGRGGDHSELGALEVQRFCTQHSIQERDAELIEFLVREHLSMSYVAQKEDLSDPQVITAFAQRVKTERHLTGLYLLTVADVRGTSPKVWNAWKGKLLEDLHRASVHALGGCTPNVHAVIEARKREALVQLALASQPHESHSALWDTLQVSYFMRHDANDIAWHTRQLARHVRPMAHDLDATAQSLTLVRARLSPAGGGLQVMVYTKDRADLFERICGYLDHAGFSILDAKIHTTHDGYALDTFQIINTHNSDHHREYLSMIEVQLSRAVQSNALLPPPRLGRVSRRVKSFPVAPRVDLHPDEKAQHWLLSVSASDRAGLLYSIARVLASHGIDVELAKVTTLGERVEGTFLIQGKSLQHQKAQIAIERELLEVLEH